jgi:hypothetical protein
MPRSVLELREGLALLSDAELRKLIVAEAKTNNAFAHKVFAATDKELFMRLNTTYDFDHLTDSLQWLSVHWPRTVLGNEDQTVENVVIELAEVRKACTWDV